jgi:hypothetical protein
MSSEILDDDLLVYVRRPEFPSLQPVAELRYHPKLLPPSVVPT